MGFTQFEEVEEVAILDGDLGFHQLIWFEHAIDVGLAESYGGRIRA